jgi:hypothetical protein
MKPFPLTLADPGVATAPGWRVMPTAAIAVWRCVLVSDAHHGTAATFVAGAPAVTLLGEPDGQ